MTLTDEQIEENGICKVCRGRGKYGHEVHNKDGTVTIKIHFCEACGGTGYEPSDGDVD